MMKTRHLKRTRRRRIILWLWFGGLLAIAVVSVIFLVVNRPEERTSSGLLRKQFESAFENERYVEAVIIADELIARSPYDDVSYLNRGSAKASLGRYQEAIVDFDRVIELNRPRDMQSLQSSVTMAYVNRGKAHMDLGNEEAAFADWTHALQLAEAEGDGPWIAKIETLLNFLSPESTEENNGLTPPTPSD